MQELKRIVESGLCPSCGSDDIGAVDYESDNEIWFECYACHWNKTYTLCDAKEAGYYFLWGQPAANVDEEE